MLTVVASHVIDLRRPGAAACGNVT